MTFAAIPHGISVFIDANTFVYHFGPHPVLHLSCQQLLERIALQESPDSLLLMPPGSTGVREIILPRFRSYPDFAKPLTRFPNSAFQLSRGGQGWDRPRLRCRAVRGHRDRNPKILADLQVDSGQGDLSVGQQKLQEGIQGGGRLRTKDLEKAADRLAHPRAVVGAGAFAALQQLGKGPRASEKSVGEIEHGIGRSG